MKKLSKQELRCDLILLLTSLIWGFTFVAQRVGSGIMPAFAFNCIRYMLGTLSLVPVLLVAGGGAKRRNEKFSVLSALPGGILMGCVLFSAASLQQVGLATTTAGKAAFITDLYVVLVPVCGIFFKERLHIAVWVSVALAVTGLFLISVTSRFTISGGDLFELAGSLFWTMHILVVDRLTKKHNPLSLSFFQFAVAAFLSFAVSLFTEHFTMQNVMNAAFPLLFGGIMSVGVAFTLQAVGQKHAKPSHAALLLSMEAVFGLLAGMMILNERMSTRAGIGCLLMVVGIVLSQSPALIKSRRTAKAEKVKGDGMMDTKTSPAESEA